MSVQLLISVFISVVAITVNNSACAKSWAVPQNYCAIAILFLIVIIIIIIINERHSNIIVLRINFKVAEIVPVVCSSQYLVPRYHKYHSSTTQYKLMTTTVATYYTPIERFYLKLSA